LQSSFNILKNSGNSGLYFLLQWYHLPVK